MIKVTGHIFCIMLLLLVSSCRVVKYLKPGEQLYTGATIHVQSEEPVNRKQISRQMEEILRPQPNQRILGIRFKLWVYYKAGETPRKKFRKWLKNKVGEPPVLYDAATPPVVSDIMENRLNNLGYFGAKVQHGKQDHGPKASVSYTVEVSQPYLIESVTFPEVLDSLSHNIRQAAAGSLIVPGNAYNLDLLKAERSRIDALMKNKGFYFFSPDYILFKADTNQNNRMIRLQVTLKTETPAKARQQYLLHNIYVLPSYQVQDSSAGQAADTVLTDGYYYLNKDSMFIPRAITRSIFLKKGELYSRKAHTLSVSRLMGMGVFRYVNIRFSDTLVNGSSHLDAYIRMSPMPRRSLQLELQAVTKSNNYTGPALTLSYKNRNLLHGAELFLFNLNTNYETQFSGNQKGLNSYELGANTQLYLPKFLLPVRIARISSMYAPRTKIDLGFRNLNRVLYFRMNAANFSYGFSWRESELKHHELNPVAITFAKLGNTTEAFNELLAMNPFLRRSFEEQFTIGGNYSFTYNSLLSSISRHRYYFHFMVDVSGNSINVMQSLFRTQRSSPDNPYSLFSYVYSQYSKLYGDGRYHLVINKNSKLAARAIAGAGIPYGNSANMPYIKQFFSGGSNSIRAFLPRTVGPGIYKKPDSLAARAFLDQAGDIKIEANLEYRFTIVSVLKGAIFADAGNIWLFRKNDALPGGEFNFSSFYRQLAVGTGFGLRLDVTYFVLRFDLGMPLRKPYIQENNGWVIRQINFRDGAWRGQNLVLNIAIGYPF